MHKLDFLPGLCYPVAVGRCVHMITAHKLKKRDLYLNRLIAFQDTEPVKIVTGIRRCGKSSLLMRMAEHLRNCLLYTSRCV